ncbi:hypothetical protein NQ176_g5492 [Zarea fungicola]|uniref:Uncharacterized protein n=1 Tax=Zarea fungicola TaxID=93591 RepID=A0ACC1N860_9HYPO|nr:hypothetical protein NQ176_g5492 [Lecanicillium fungicola]
MWSWFGGGSSQNRKDSPKNAILGLRSQLDMLQKRQTHLENQIADQDAAARKQVAANNTSAAKAALRRKKAHERSLEQTEAQIGTLEQQINAIESANINRSTLQAMENASAAMKSIHGKLTPEKVDETMDKIREQNELSDEIVNALTSSTLANAVDEQDLEDELDQLQQEQLDEAMTKTGTVPVLASPPIQDPVSNRKQAVEEDEEEEELRKLQAAMAM